ncbi:MAG TPA: protein kinase [Alphaproteobacteria bacterium]|nr:protein kinase [Alphaproteobacteria bacterium]
MTEILFQNSTLIAERYEITSFVAEGGMQQVYKALDTRLNREVALKTPINDSGQKRFKSSAKMSARVTHPNTAKTFDFFEFEKRQFLVEEFIEGMNLKERYTRDFNYLDPHFACYLIQRIARGVAASHHAGVFHRDLKPSNIMVSNEPTPQVLKITDFGIAKMAEKVIADVINTTDDEEKTLAIETSKTVKGTVPYMAPELLQNSNPGLPADIWAVGAIGYELLTGLKPYGDGLKAIAKVMLQKPPTKPLLRNNNLQFSTLNDELWKVLEQCFNFNPDQRIKADSLVIELGKLCYSSASRIEGLISNYGPNRGDHGFIREGDKDVFFHRESFYGDKPIVGQRVAFSTSPGQPNPRAFPILPLK